MIGSALSRISMADKLSIPQLQQAIQNGTIPAYVGVPLLQEKVKQSQQARAMAAAPAGQPPIAQQVMQEAEGLTAAQSNLPEFTAFDGGIVAFAGGDLVDDEEDDDAEESKFDKQLLAENEDLANQLLAGYKGTSPDYSVLGVPPYGRIMGRAEGQGITAILRPEGAAPPTVAKTRPPIAAQTAPATAMVPPTPAVEPTPEAVTAAPAPVETPAPEGIAAAPALVEEPAPKGIAAAPALVAKAKPKAKAVSKPKTVSDKGIDVLAPTTGITMESAKQEHKPGIKPFRHKYEKEIIREAKRIGLDPNLAMKLAMRETGSRDTPPETAESGAGAQGVMQLMPVTAKEMGVKNVFDPHENIRGGLGYYKKLLNKYRDARTAAAAYNWGPGNVDRWIKAGADPKKLPAETRKYLVGFAQGGEVQAFKKGGESEDEGDSESSMLDYAPYALAAPDIARLGLRGLRGIPSLPYGAAGRGAANVLGSGVRAYAVPGVPAVLGAGGYQLSKRAANVMASPQGAPLREALTQNYMLGATAPDDALAAAILEQSQPDARSQALAENESLKDAPWYTRMYGIGRTEWLKKHPPQAKPVVTEEGKVLPRGKDIEKAEAALAEQARAIEEGRGPHALAEAERERINEAIRAATGESKEGEGKKEAGVSDFEALLTKREAAAEKRREEDRYMSILAAGLGMMSGTSPYALSNIGTGAMKGVETAAALSKLRGAEERGLMDARTRQYALQQNEALRKTMAATAEKDRIYNIMTNARRAAMDNIVKARKLDISTMDQNQLAVLEREADSYLSRDPAYQAMYKTLYGGVYNPGPASSPAVNYDKMYGLTPKNKG